MVTIQRKRLIQIENEEDLRYEDNLKPKLEDSPRPSLHNLSCDHCNSCLTQIHSNMV